ncbi:hypothetical protein D3C81_1257750 [compost metagenome]
MADQEVQADGGCQPHRAKAQPLRNLDVLRLGHQGTAAAAERGAPGLQVEAAAIVAVFVEGIDPGVGGQGTEQYQQGVDHEAAVQITRFQRRGDAERHAGQRQQQKAPANHPQPVQFARHPCPSRFQIAA